MPDAPRIMSRAEYARHRDVSRPAVTKWAQIGRIALANDGRVLVDESDALLAATVQRRGPKPKAAVAPTAQQAAAARPVEGSLTEARTDQARAKARLDDLEYRKRAGELVDRGGTTKAIADSLAPILSRLDSLSTRAAPRLLQMTEVGQIQDVIDEEVVAIRQEIADVLRAMMQ
jgi:hypothetical protein